MYVALQIHMSGGRIDDLDWCCFIDCGSGTHNSCHRNSAQRFGYVTICDLFLIILYVVGSKLELSRSVLLRDTQVQHRPVNQWNWARVLGLEYVISPPYSSIEVI